MLRQRPRPGLIALLVLSACATFPRAPDEGGPAWVEVRTPHFRLATDLDAAVARGLATELETWTASISILDFLDLRTFPEPVWVIAVRSRGESQQVNANINGRYADMYGVGPMLYIGQRDTASSDRLVKHELVHALLAASLSRAPQWVHEGLANYLEDVSYDADRGEVTWGLVAAERMVDPKSCPPARELVDARPWPVHAVGRYTRCAGLLMSLLHERHPAQLDCYLTAIHRSEDSQVGIQRCFPD